MIRIYGRINRDDKRRIGDDDKSNKNCCTCEKIGAV